MGQGCNCRVPVELDDFAIVFLTSPLLEKEYLDVYNLFRQQ